MLKNFPVFLIVFSGLLSVKRAVAHNEIETAWEVLCSSKLNFQFLEMNFQNERTVSEMSHKGWFWHQHLWGLGDHPMVAQPRSRARSVPRAYPKTSAHTLAACGPPARCGAPPPLGPTRPRSPRGPAG